MPFTPLHYCIAYVIHRWKRNLSLPALAVSSMIPDVENVFLYIITGGVRDRLVLHSLFGAVTLGMVLSVFLTVNLYPSLVSFHFNIDKEKVQGRCRFSGVLILTCIIGCVSHVLLDSLSHAYNPLFYPFTNESFEKLLLFSNRIHATIFIQVTLTLFTILIIFLETREGTQGFLNRMLVG